MQLFPSSRFVFPLMLAVYAASAQAEDKAPLPCTASDGITPICGFQRPEDLEIVADGTRLLVSEYGSLSGAKPGRLTLFDPASDLRRELAPGGMTVGTADWGATDCPGPPGAEFSPHGIHHAAIGGDNRVLVVNHGAREAVELFEIVHPHDGAKLALRWRGCVPVPTGIWMNDVVGLPAGGLAVSHMVARDVPEETMLEQERNQAQTGWVLRWQPDSGWSKIAGSDGGLPNGLEVAADGATLYVNEYFGDRVTAIDLASGKRLWSTAVSGPDNSSWSSTGVLLVASHLADLGAVFACGEHPDQPCALPYAIVAIRPGDGAAVTFIKGGIDDPMGGATVAVDFGDELFLGSFVGDRMIRRARPPTPALP